jgi:hypothetical protein
MNANLAMTVQVAHASKAGSGSMRSLAHAEARRLVLASAVSLEESLD